MLILAIQLLAYVIIIALVYRRSDVYTIKDLFVKPHWVVWVPVANIIMLLCCLGYNIYKLFIKFLNTEIK